MAHIRSEGYGAERIDVPDCIAHLIGTRPPYFDESVFIVSRSDENIFCSLVLTNTKNTHIKILYSSSYKTTWIPTWVCLSGIPQYLFDNLLKGFLIHKANLSFGNIFIPQITKT